MRTALACLVVAVFGLVLWPLPAQAEEDPEELVRRFFHVGALTAGQVDYIQPVMGAVSPDMVSDEENPLFGAEGEEPMLPVGTVDELIEELTRNVDPVSWEITEGAHIRPLGEGTLYVQTTRRVMALVARYLADLEAKILASVTVEARAVRGALPRGKRLTAEEVEALKAGPSVSIGALLGQKVVGYSGRQFSYVQDYDVEVAKDASCSDPIVGVTNYGLAVAARVLAGDDPGRLRVQLRANLAQLREVREHTTWGGKDERARIVELPIEEEASTAADLLVAPGTWHVVGGDGGADPGVDWLFLVRVTPTPRGDAKAGAGTVFGAPSPADSGPLVTRTFDVMDLMNEVPDYRGEEVNLVPSNFTPPEPPELPDPEPFFPWQAFYDLIPQIVMPKSWNRQGAGIEMRNGRLLVRNTERALDAVSDALRNLRREFLWNIHTRAELIVVDPLVARALAAPGPDGHLLDAGRRARLAKLLERGAARRADWLEVVSPGDARNAVTSGRRISYLQDFEVEIAEGTTIANPVVQAILVGTVLDVYPSLTSTDDAVNLAVHFRRGEFEEPMRQAETPHGTVDAPEMDVFRLSTNLRVPLGRTAVIGAGTRGEKAWILLLTPTIERYGTEAR